MNKSIKYKGKALLDTLIANSKLYYNSDWVCGNLIITDDDVYIIQTWNRTNGIGYKHEIFAIVDVDTISEYINYKDKYDDELYTNDIIYYHRHEGSYSEGRAVDKLGVILWDDRALGYRIFPIDTHSYKINSGVDGEKIKTSHRIVKVGNSFDSNIKDLVETYL